MSFMSRFVDFAFQTRYEDIPEKAIKIAKMSLVDTVGVMLYASQSRHAAALRRCGESRPDCRESTIIGHLGKASMLDAALVNGMLAHLDDYDEVSIPGHTAAVAAPAILALAEKFGLGGKALLRAYCLGMELDFKIAKVACDEISSFGWHSTSAIGTLGVAAMAALALGLNRNEFHSALAVAASRAGGLMANFGTLTKPYHVGMAAKNGIESALLARAGLTGSENALEGRNGYFHCFAQKTIPEEHFSFHGPWELETHGMLFKEYPSCLGSHSSVRTLTAMMREHGFTLDEVESVRAGVGPYSHSCLRYEMPENALEAKFSMAFPLARVLLNGELKGSDFVDEKVAAPEIQPVMRMVSVEAAEEFKFKFVHENSPCILRVLLKDGRTLERRGEIYYFSPACWDNLISEEKLLEKFVDCGRGKLAVPIAESCFSRFMTIERMDDITEVMKTLAS